MFFLCGKYKTNNKQKLQRIMKQYLIMAVIGIAAAVVTNKWIMPMINGNN